MALHGGIYVNDHPIGYWSAVRQQHPPGEVNEYKVKVLYTDPVGEQFEFETILEHRFAEGALKLAAKILTWAHVRLALDGEIE